MLKVLAEYGSKLLIKKLIFLWLPGFLLEQARSILTHSQVAFSDLILVLILIALVVAAVMTSVAPCTSGLKSSL
eukprot:s1265_g6.t1